MLYYYLKTTFISPSTRFLRDRKDQNLIKHSRGMGIMAISECPSCTFHIAVQSNMEEGDVMKCPDCGAMLKLAKASPPVFELASKEE